MKRFFDFIVSLIAVLVLSPLLVCTFLLVYRYLSKPVLFKQTRIGLNNKPFEIIKFRSMRDAFNETGSPLSDEQRLTPFGKMLRASSIDELPSLWNILKGDMSIVGPRPQDARFIDKCTPQQNRRHEVRPGLTGWAQINGRNGISWDERFDLDVWYVDNQSFLLDLKIILVTVPLVLLRKGISAPGCATMPAFNGSQKPSYDAAE